MKFVLLIAVALLTLTPLSNHSAVQAQKVSAGYDKTLNFSNFKTFMFANTDGARNPYVNEMILAGVERELTARGLTKVAADADLRVSYLTAYGYGLQVARVSFGTTVNPIYSGVITSRKATWDVVEGTLLIDLYDNQADRIVFRGTGKDVLQRAPSMDPAADAKTVSKTVKKVISKIFKKYPKNR